jgi:subfamily B ATP-binding cassette protein HlyB/CyaB
MLSQLLIHPHIRARLNKNSNAALRTILPGETISGIDTVKAMAVEPRWVHKW